jgi:uncharacterized protein YcaQ
VLSAELARRLFIRRQRLTGPRPAADATGIMETVRDLRCVQLDPISVVDRTHRLVLWSRVGRFEQAELDRLLWQERELFEYWAHCASIVLTEDYPIHNLMMRRYPGGGEGGPQHVVGAWAARTLAWMNDNARLRRHILTRLRKEGPLPSRALTEDGLDPRAWVSTGWASGRNVSRMLDFLWAQGKIMVAGRSGGQKLWDLAERTLPAWAPRERLSPLEVERRGAERALRALGVATARHIQLHFIRGRYRQLPRVLGELERAGRIVRAQVDGWPGTWYVHAEDLPLIEHIDSEWTPRTVLLSPFDNLICDRARTRRFFDFDYSIEIYTPPARRKYGYYVLPILHGDRLIGRIDPMMERETGRLVVKAVYAEAEAPRSAGAAVAATVEELAGFLGAREIRYDRRRVAPVWRSQLKQ